MLYQSTGSFVTSGSISTILTANATEKFLVKTIHATNVTSSAAALDIMWKDNSQGDSLLFLAKGITVPQASSFQALDGTFVLDNSDELLAETSVSGSIHLTVSYLQITGSEG